MSISHMILVYYGIEQVYMNVTSATRAHARLTSGGGTVVIPCGDEGRTAAWGDPVPGVVKHVLLVDHTGAALNVHVFSRAIISKPLDAAATTLAEHVTVVDTNEERKAWWRDAGRHIPDVGARLDALHARTTLLFGSKEEQELPEQLLALRFVQPTDKVLEIGGNIGRNSCTLAQILDDDRNLVVLESLPLYARQLAINRQLNGFQFHIESSALSAKPLFQQGWVTSVSGGGNGGAEVNTITLEQLRARYRIDFNVLVADCEGALAQILADYPTLLQGMRAVIIENDFRTAEDQHAVDEALKAAGLVCASSEPGPSWAPGASQHRFFEAWVRM